MALHSPHHHWGCSLLPPKPPSTRKVAQLSWDVLSVTRIWRLSIKSDEYHIPHSYMITNRNDNDLATLHIYIYVCVGMCIDVEVNCICFSFLFKMWLLKNLWLHVWLALYVYWRCSSRFSMGDLVTKYPPRTEHVSSQLYSSHPFTSHLLGLETLLLPAQAHRLTQHDCCWGQDLALYPMRKTSPHNSREIAQPWRETSC